MNKDERKKNNWKFNNSNILSSNYLFYFKSWGWTRPKLRAIY